MWQYTYLFQGFECAGLYTCFERSRNQPYSELGCVGKFSLTIAYVIECFYIKLLIVCISAVSRPVDKSQNTKEFLLC